MKSESGSAAESFPGIRIVFMGTPEFAVSSLDALLKAGANIVGVVTAPDRPAGRGLKPRESAVKEYALANGLKILQPEKLKDPYFLEELKALHADLQVVVAFRMLPELVWNMPAMGTVNVHGSLLPRYRGAAPINWAVINGERFTGVTTFKLKHAIDTGNILLQKSFPIGDDETAGQVHDRMKEIGASLLLETIRGLVAGTIKETPQAVNDELISEQQIKQAPKLTTETAKIDWQKPVDEIYNLIRGLSPFPTAYSYLNGRLIKIYRAGKEYSAAQSEPGAYQTDKKRYLKFRAADGFIYIEEIQMEGKKRMQIEDFLRGYKFE